MPKDESSGFGAVCVFLVVVFVPSAFKHIVFVNMSQSRDGDVETSEYDIKVDTGNTVANPVVTVRDNNSGNKISIVKANRAINSNGAGRGEIDEVLIRNYE